MYRSNSTTNPPFVDGTSSSNESGIVETTARPDALGSLMKNWVIFSVEPVVALPQIAPSTAPDPTPLEDA